MSGTASDQWFWNDWQGEPCLKLCSLAAQGLWMKMLCLAAEAPRRGFVMVADRYATDDDIVMLGTSPKDPSEVVHRLLKELDHNRVFSRDRNGHIYCRRMVRAEKLKRSSSKGGKIGGRSTYEKRKGIFSTQAPTQGDPQPPRRASHPIPNPIPPKKKEEESSLMRAGNGNGTTSTRARDHSTVTVLDPTDRIARFQQKLAKQIGPGAWTLIDMAMHPKHPDHGRALTICQNAARALDKGWPHNWPNLEAMQTAVQPATEEAHHA